MVNRKKVQLIFGVMLTILVVTVISFPYQAAASSSGAMDLRSSRRQAPLLAPLQQSDPTQAPPDDNYEGMPPFTPMLPEQALPQDISGDNYDGIPPALPLPIGQVTPLQNTPDDNYVGEVPTEQPVPSQDPPDNNAATGEQAKELHSNESVAPTTSISVVFPATGDTYNVANYPYWWSDGDRVEGNRVLGSNWVSSVTYNLQISNNILIAPGHVDFNLSINGIVVGSFTVLPGETSKSVSFSFPSISGPSYIIRLEETNTVAIGAGSIVIPLDISSITFFGNTFPATGDTINVANYPYWWNAGDRAVGVRTPGIDWVDSLTYDLQISDNLLSAPGHVDFDLSINGIVVGSFTVLPGETSKSVSFSFPSISGPSYIIRLEETNTVAIGAGSIVIPLDISSITFSGNTFPATGDTINVANYPYWWTAGDRAVGVRTPGPDWVTGITYNLILSSNILSAPGHVDFDLSINSIVVGSFTVLPGETSKSVSFSFPSISGPSYIIRLEETNTVGPGLGSIVIPLNISTIRFFGNKFPTFGDTINVANYPYWWVINDRAVGSRMLGMDSVSGVTYNLQISSNILSAPGHIDFDMYINSIKIGSFTVLPGDVAKSVSFSFAPILGPNYVIMLKETNTVGPGLGSIVIPLNKSTIQFRTSVFLPAIRR